MLLGREAELERLQRLLDDAHARASSALIVHGGPGIGKTSLLEAAIARAPKFIILRAQPLEAESELPFAGLSDLARPILRLLERLPSPQAAALAGALALGPPSPGDRFAVATATLSLLAAASYESPVLAVVDDAHSLDTASREALLFAGRRLGNEGVVLLLAMRDRDWIASAGLETRELAPLARAAAAALLDSVTNGVDSTVRDRIVLETGGNPLALTAARSALHEALAVFEASSAEPWAEQALIELRATGDAPAPVAAGSVRELTPQELQAALVVANGATNKEAAAGPVPEPEDRGVPPAQHVSQARRALAGAARLRSGGSLR